MKPIKRIDLNQLRNNEHFQFQTEFKYLVAEYKPTTLKIETLFNNSYLPLYQNEDEALQKVMKNSNTEKREEADKQRDATFKGIASMVNAYLNHYDEEVAEAAYRLNILFDTYGNVATLPLNEETSAIYNLIQDLRGKYASDAEKVAIPTWINRLDADNAAYEALRKSSLNEDASRTELKMKQTRNEIDVVYRDIVNRLEALVLIEGETDYAEFVKRINLILDKYNHTLAQRKAIKNSQKKSKITPAEDNS